MAPLCICAHPHSLSKLREEAPPATSVKDVQGEGEVETEEVKVGAEAKSFSIPLNVLVAQLA